MTLLRTSKEIQEQINRLEQELIAAQVSERNQLYEQSAKDKVFLLAKELVTGAAVLYSTDYSQQADYRQPRYELIFRSKQLGSVRINIESPK